MSRPAWRAVLAVCLALALAACADGPPDREPPPAAADSPLPDLPPAGSPPAESSLTDSPLDTCEGLADPPAGAAGPAPQPAPDGLPDLALPCFTGGVPFTLADLRGPAVVNLWASWCPPCRAELPVLQQYADQAGGQVHVLGVVVQDRRSAAASLAADLGLTFPSLDDPDGRALAEVGAIALPATLYLAATGAVVHLHQGPLDEDTLAQQSADHLGVPGPGAAG